VQCGVYRRQAVVRVGGFDPAMVYGEDEELNWRLRRAGYRILLAEGMRFHYVTRSTWRAALRQYSNYGEARVRVVDKHPEFLRWHHLVPAAGVAGGVVLVSSAPFSAAARRLLRATASGYAAAACLAAASATDGDLALAPRVAAAFAALHLGYGIGVLRGITSYVQRRGAAWRTESMMRSRSTVRSS
jgi:hypothetical protein